MAVHCLPEGYTATGNVETITTYRRTSKKTRSYTIRRPDGTVVGHERRLQDAKDAAAVDHMLQITKTAQTAQTEGPNQ